VNSNAPLVRDKQVRSSSGRTSRRIVVSPLRQIASRQYQLRFDIRADARLKRAVWLHGFINQGQRGTDIG